MLKKIGRILSVIVIFIVLAAMQPASAADNSVNLYFFHSESCPHCIQESAFLDSIRPGMPFLTVKKYEISKNTANAILYAKVGRELKMDTAGVPMTFIGNDTVIGYQDEDTTGKHIITLIAKYQNTGDPDPVGDILSGKQVAPRPVETTAMPDTIRVPVLGNVSIKSLSLPVLTFVIALLDGFNPCAMWTLLFLISLLLGMKDRFRMWVLGTAFIATSAFVYFMFLAAWLNLFMFVGAMLWVRIAIGAVAIGCGTYYLRDYLKNRDGACAVTGNEKRRMVFEKLKTIATRREFFLALLGIILIAFAVNIVELFCSAGLPAVYTRVLSQSSLPQWQYYLYLLFYVTVFMIDDLVVFVTAMVTLKAVGMDSTFARTSHLIGGILMIAIGALLIFAPQFLTFG